MPQDLEKVYGIIQNFAKEIKLKRPIIDMIYRSDAQEYQFLFEGNYHSEIREKLIDGFIADPKNGDIRREIRFRLENSVLFEDHEGPARPQAPGEEKIQVDDD